MFSFWLQDLASEIHAIDISKENIKTLDETIKDNGFFNITTYNIGISDYTGSGLIEKKGKASKGGWRLGVAGTESIDVYTLNDFLTKYRIEKVDILKLDVEGEEIKIINSDDFPFDKIKTILGEYHYENSNDNTKLRFENRLKEHNFDIIWHPNGHFIAR